MRAILKMQFSTRISIFITVKCIKNNTTTKALIEYFVHVYCEHNAKLLNKQQFAVN